MRFKKCPQLPGAGRTRAWHHDGSHTPTSPGAILISEIACQPKHFGRQCTDTGDGPYFVFKFLTENKKLKTILPMPQARKFCSVTLISCTLIKNSRVIPQPK